VKRVILELLKATTLGRYARSEDLDPSRVRLSIKNGKGKQKRLRVDFHRGVLLDVDALNRDIADAEEEDRGDDQAIAEAAAASGAVGPSSAIPLGAPSLAAQSDAMSTGVSSRGDHHHAGRDASITGGPAGAASVGGATTTATPYQTTSFTHPRSWLHEDWSINWNLSQYRSIQQGLDSGLEGVDGNGQPPGQSARFADKDDPLGFLGPNFLDSLRGMGVRVSSAKIFRIRMEATWEDVGGGVLGLLNGIMGAPIAMKVEGVELVVTPRETKKEKTRLGTLLGLAGTSTVAQQPASGGDVVSWAGGGTADDLGCSSHHGGASHTGGSHKRGAGSGFLGIFGSSVTLGHASGSRYGGSRNHHNRDKASSLRRQRSRNSANPLPSSSSRNRPPRTVPAPASGALPAPAAQMKKAASSAFGLGALSGMFGGDKLRARQNREVELVSKRRRRVLERLDSRRRQGEEALRHGPWGWLGASGFEGNTLNGWKFAKKEALSWKSFRRNFVQRAVENVILELEGVHVQVVVRRPEGSFTGKKKKKPRGQSDSGGGWMAFGSSGGQSFSGGERPIGEDGEQERQDCFTMGIVLDMFSIHDTDANGNRVYDEPDKVDRTQGFVFKSVKFSGLGVYMEEGGAEALDRGSKNKDEENDLPPNDEDDSLFSESLAVSAWRKHGDGYGVHRRYVVNPLSFEAAYRQKRNAYGGNVNGSTEDRTKEDQPQDDPKYLLFSQMSHLSAVLSKHQLGLINEMVEAVLISSTGSTPRSPSLLHLQPLFPEYRPACSITALTVSDWWKYAIRSTIRLNSRAKERGYPGRRTLWRDFMDAFRKRQRYLDLYRRHCWGEKQVSKDKKMAAGTDLPWDKPLSTNELSEMHSIESDRFISVEAVVKWRAQAELDVHHEMITRKGTGMEADGCDKAKVGIVQGTPGKFLGMFRGSGSGGIGDGSEQDGREIDPPSKEDIRTLRLELEACYPPSFSSSITSEQREMSSAELEMSIGFVVLDLVQANLSPVAKVRLGPIETSYRISEGASYFMSFTLSSLQIEDQTSMGDMAFPSIIRSVHHMRNSQDEDITIDGTVDTGFSGVTETSGISQDQAPAPAVHLAIDVLPSRESEEKNTKQRKGTILFRTTSFEVVFSTAFLCGMSNFFSLNLSSGGEQSFHLSNSHHCDDDEEDIAESPGTHHIAALHTLAWNIHQKIRASTSRAGKVVFSQVDERGRRRQTKWAVDALIGSPVLIFPPHTDAKMFNAGFSSLGGIESGSSSRALAVRLGQQHLVSTNSSGPGAPRQFLSDIRKSGDEGESSAVDRWKLQITGAAVALGPPVAGEWLRRIDESVDDKEAIEQTTGVLEGLDVLIAPLSLNVEIGTSISTKKGESDVALHQLVWLQCTLASLEMNCKPVEVISAVSNIQQWNHAWDESVRSRSPLHGEMFSGHDEMRTNEIWEFDFALAGDARFFSLLGPNAFPTPIHDSLHISGSLGCLSIELDGGSYGHFEVRLSALSLSHSSGRLDSASSKGKFGLGEFWLLHKSETSGDKLIFSPSVESAALPYSSAMVDKFYSIGDQSDSGSHKSVSTEKDGIDTEANPLVNGFWRISSVQGKHFESLTVSEHDSLDVGAPTSLHLRIGNATTNWHCEIIENLMEMWREVRTKSFAAKPLNIFDPSAMPGSSSGGLDLNEEDDESHSSVSTSPSLLESTYARAQGSWWFVHWLFPIWGVVRDAVFIPSPEALVSVHAQLNAVALVMHFGEDQDKQPQFLTAIAHKATSEITVQGHNEMNVSFELGKLSLERSLTYRVRSENRCLFNSIGSPIDPDQCFLVVSYSRQASTASADMHDPNTFRTRAITMIQILPARIVYIGEHMDLLARFMDMIGIKALFSPSTGSVTKLLQLDTVEQEVQCTATDLLVDIPEAAHSLSKIVIRVKDLVARHTRIPFAGGGEGKLDIRGVTAEFHDGHKLLDEPVDTSVDMILSPVDDSGNHQVMKVEAYLPELIVRLKRSHYDQCLATLYGNIKSAPATGTNLLLTKKSPKETKNAESSRHVTMKLEINVNTEHISVKLENDGEITGPVAHIKCEGGNILLQSIPANEYFQIDGNAESIVVGNGYIESETTSCFILSKLDGSENNADGGRMLLVHYEKNSDISTEFSIIFGDCQAVISRSFLEKVSFFFDVPSADQGRVRPDQGNTPEQASGSKSTVKLRTATLRLLFGGAENLNKRYALEGQYDADCTVKRSSSGKLLGIEVQANCSSFSFYKMDRGSAHILEPTTLSIMASSTHSKSRIEQEIKVIALTPISLHLPLQDAVFLRAACWFLSDISLDIVGGMPSQKRTVMADTIDLEQSDAINLDQSLDLGKRSSLVANEAALSDLIFLSEQKVLPNKDREVQATQTKVNLLPVSTQLSLIFPNLTAMIMDKPIGANLFKMEAENIFCDGVFTSRTEVDCHSSLAYPSTCQLRFSSGCKSFDESSNQWKEFVSRCDVSFGLKQEERSGTENGARYIMRSSVEVQPFTLSLSNIVVRNLCCATRAILSSSSAALDHNSIIMAEGRDRRKWVDRFEKDIFLGNLRIPLFDVSVFDSETNDEPGQLVATLRLEDMKIEQVSMLCAPKSEDNLHNHCNNSRLVGTIRTLRVIPADGSSTAIECCPYGSDALKVSIFSQTRANSGEVTIDDAEIIAGSTDPVNHFAVNATDIFILRLADTFGGFLSMTSGPLDSVKRDNRSKEEEKPKLYHVKRLQVNPIQLKLNIEPDGNRYDGKGKGSPLFSYLTELSHSSKKKELSLAELSVENVTGARFIALAFLYREYASRLSAANVPDASEITEEDLLKERQGDIPTVVFVDDAESSSKLANVAALEEFKACLQQLDCQSPALANTNGDELKKEEPKPLQKLGSMFRMGSFRQPMR